MILLLSEQQLGDVISFLVKFIRLKIQNFHGPSPIKNIAVGVAVLPPPDATLVRFKVELF
jgi:hypothetical protein